MGNINAVVMREKLHKREKHGKSGNTVTQQELLYSCQTPAVVIHIYYEYLVTRLLSRLSALPICSSMTQFTIFTNRYYTFLHFIMLILGAARGSFFLPYNGC